MSESEHSAVFESLGAYALGALPDAERARVALHVETCPICAEDAASMERAVTRLIDVVPDVAPPPELRDRIMAVVEREAALLRATARPPEPVVSPRRRRRFADSLSLRWATAAAAALVLGGVVGSQVFGGAGGADTRTLQADVGKGHAWIEMNAGKAKLVVDGLAPPGDSRVYELWVQHGTDAPRPASENLSDAVFVVRSGNVEIPARLDDGDRVLVTSEPMGGSRTPTTAPVVVTSRV